MLLQRHNIAKVHYQIVLSPSEKLIINFPKKLIDYSEIIFHGCSEQNSNLCSMFGNSLILSEQSP